MQRRTADEFGIQRKSNYKSFLVKPSAGTDQRHIGDRRALMHDRNRLHNRNPLHDRNRLQPNPRRLIATLPVVRLIPYRQAKASWDNGIMVQRWMARVVVIFDVLRTDALSKGLYAKQGRAVGHYQREFTLKLTVAFTSGR